MQHRRKFFAESDALSTAAQQTTWTASGENVSLGMLEQLRFKTACSATEAS